MDHSTNISIVRSLIFLTGEQKKKIGVWLDTVNDAKYTFLALIVTVNQYDQSKERKKKLSAQKKLGFLIGEILNTCMMYP